MNGKKKFLEAMNIGCCKRCTKMCSNKHDEIMHKYLGGRWPEVKEATHPSLILWKNLGYGKIDRCLHSCYVSFFALLLMIGGFSIVIALIFYKNSYSATSAIDCGNTEYTID